MRSFAVRLEPCASPRLAAAALLLHAGCAAAPWLMRVPALPAAILSAIALAGLAQTLTHLPGRHCRLAGVRHDGLRWEVRPAGACAWQPAELCKASRAYPALAYVALRAGRERFGWLLPPASIPGAEFRRLKARIRLAC